MHIVAENNTGGLVIFDLPGNPVVGRDVRVNGEAVTAVPFVLELP